MATFKVVVQKPRKDGFYTVYIRMTHNRRVCFIKTDKLVGSKGIVPNTKEVKDSFVLSGLMSNINKWIDKLNRVDSSGWSLEDVKKFVLFDEDGVCFSDFAREYINKLYDVLEPGSVKTYHFTLQNFERFVGSEKIMFHQITTRLLEEWIKSLSSQKAVKFSYPIYLKKLFNEGLKEFNDYDNNVILIRNNPWLRIEIPKMKKAAKKAITMEECRKFFALSSSKPSVCLTMDVCKMIFCLAGINVADLYSMQKSCFYDGILHYNRRKTKNKRDDHAYIEMKVPDMLLPTIQRHLSGDNDPFLFDFHKDRSMVSLNSILSYTLRDICKDVLGLPKESHYTPYTFRHSWATIAQNDLGASYEEIAFALNHVSAHKITMGYVKPDFSRAWELNEKVVEKVFFTNDESKRNEKHQLPVFEKVDETYELVADAYYMGEVVGHVDGKGFKDTEEILSQLMAGIRQDVPKRCTIQIKVVNVTKSQTKFFERIRNVI